MSSDEHLWIHWIVVIPGSIITIPENWEAIAVNCPLTDTVLLPSSNYIWHFLMIPLLYLQPNSFAFKELSVIKCCIPLKECKCRYLRLFVWFPSDADMAEESHLKPQLWVLHPVGALWGLHRLAEMALQLSRWRRWTVTSSLGLLLSLICIALGELRWSLRKWAGCSCGHEFAHC